MRRRLNSWIRCSSVRRNRYARREALAVLAAHVPVVDQGLQGRQRGPDPQPLVDPAVHQLQQLDGELDVAQSALAQLELPTGVAGRDVRDDPLAHRLRVGDEVLPIGGAPHHRSHHVDEVPAQLEVAGARPGLEHRLELPGLGPPLVVGPMAGQRPDQLTRLALGAQRGVDLPDGAGRGVRRADPGQLGGEPGGHGDRLLVADHGLAVVVQHRLGDEEHVDIADVVQLLGAALAQGDHGQPGLQTSGPNLARPMARAASRVASARSDSSSAMPSTASIGSGAHRSRAAICSRGPR